ncbi:MAG: hypothetical protein ACXVAN_18955 [Polyangia bacterium]
MWSAFARATALAALALAGCGPRALDVTLTVDAAGCTLSVPAGGSVSYQVEANGISAGSGSFCGGCLAVDTAIAGSDALIAFLRAHAPSCAGVHPGTTIAVRVTGWSSGGCPAANAPNFCADAPSQLVPDGTSDATLSFALICKPQCSTICVPTTCMAQGKDCGAISDGCNMVLECGTCHPPLKCGAVTPNVCGR